MRAKDFALRGAFGSLDPRARTAFTLASLMVVFRAEGIVTLVFCSLLVTLVILTERLNWRRFTRPVRYLAWLLPITFAVHLLLAPEVGAVSIREGWNGLSAPAVVYAGFYTARITTMLLITALLIATVSTPELVESLRRMGRPLRVFRARVEEIALVIYLTLSFVPILGEEAERLREAQTARGIRRGGSLRNRIAGTLPLIIPLFFTSLRRADRLAVAMESRGYSSGHRRTSYMQLRFVPVDALFTAAMVLWVATSF